MDPNSAPSVVVNAISSSVDSPINRLPNEMMHLIVAKLEPDGVREFVRLRLISTRWQAVIDDFCRRSKSLIVCLQPAIHRPYRTRASILKDRFFGTAKSIDFSELILLYPQMSSQCLKSLENQFANLEQLSIRCDNDYRLSDVVAYINSLNSLKQLDFVAPFALTLPLNLESVQEALLNLSPTLFKLVHFSFTSVRAYDQSVLLRLVSQLGPNCVRVYFCCDLTIHQWDNNITLPCLANLTHVSMCILGKDVLQFVHFLCEHATSLKVLEFRCKPDYVLALTPTVLRDLASLTQLVELCLWSFEIRNFSELEQAVAQPPSGLTSLPSVLTCKLRLFLLKSEPPVSAGQFARLISIILPNLVNLDLRIEGKSSVDSQFKAEIEQQHLKRLPNLRKHEIVAYL